MQWKEKYNKIVNGFCLMSSDNIIANVNLERPSFADILIPNEKATGDVMFAMKLDETKASEEDYKNFCYYVFELNGYNPDDYLGTSDDDKEKGEEDMELNKIKKLLKTYGASDNEINNFISDLQEDKEEIEEDEDFNYLDSETMNKLKADDKGKDIIMNAPTMKREELKKLVKEYLSKE